MTEVSAASTADHPHHPLDVGTRVTCQRSANAALTECDIIERECVDGTWRYYVHFDGTGGSIHGSAKKISSSINPQRAPLPQAELVLQAVAAPALSLAGVERHET